jgi:hypothetical protein
LGLVCCLASWRSRCLSLSVELTPSTSARTQLFTNTTHTAIQFPLRNANCRVKSTPAQVCPSRQCERQPSQQPETNRLLFVLQNLLWIQKSRLGSRLASRLGSVFPAERAIRDRVVQCAANTPQLYAVPKWMALKRSKKSPARAPRRAPCGVRGLCQCQFSTAPANLLLKGGLLGGEAPWEKSQCNKKISMDFNF